MAGVNYSFMEIKQDKYSFYASRYLLEDIMGGSCRFFINDIDVSYSKSLDLWQVKMSELPFKPQLLVEYITAIINFISSFIREPQDINGFPLVVFFNGKDNPHKYKKIIEIIRAVKKPWISYSILELNSLKYKNIIRILFSVNCKM